MDRSRAVFNVCCSCKCQRLQLLLVSLYLCLTFLRTPLGKHCLVAPWAVMHCWLSLSSEDWPFIIRTLLENFTMATFPILYESQKEIFLGSSYWELGTFPRGKTQKCGGYPFTLQSPEIPHSHASSYSASNNLSKLLFYCFQHSWLL